MLQSSCSLQEFWVPLWNFLVFDTGEKWSNDILKAAFKKLHSTIIRELDVHDVIDDLYSEDIVDTNFVQEMNSKVNDSTTVRQLLTHLHSLNNVNTFKILRQALWSDTNKSKYSLLLSEIEKCCSELEKSQQVTAVKSTIPHGDVYVSSTENVTKQAQQLEPAKGKFHAQTHTFGFWTRRSASKQSLKVIKAWLLVVHGMVYKIDCVISLISVLANSSRYLDWVDHRQHLAFFAGPISSSHQCEWRLQQQLSVFSKIVTACHQQSKFAGGLNYRFYW